MKCLLEELHYRNNESTVCEKTDHLAPMQSAVWAAKVTK